MRVAVMMRAMDKEAGFRALTEGLVSTMLELAPDDTFILIHQSDKWLSRFARYPNARPVLAPVRSNFLWDQIAVPWIAWKEHADVITNPKFFVPFIASCPVTMGVQEPSWFTRPEEYGTADRIYQRIMIPKSIRRSAHVFPNSRFILEENRRILRMPIEHATIQYSAAGPEFQPIRDVARLEAFRRKLDLPQPFILVMTRVIHPGMKTTEFFPGKSPEIAYRAFARIRDQIPHHIVFAGHRVKEYLAHTEGARLNTDKVKFIEFIPYEEINLAYSLADIFVNPCAYEGCPNTVLQAMACGAPMVVADAGGSADVAEGAAMMARSMDDADFAAKILALAQDPALRKEHGARSLARSKDFTWEKTASATLTALRSVVARRTHRAA